MSSRILDLLTGVIHKPQSGLYEIITSLKNVIAMQKLEFLLCFPLPAIASHVESKKLTKAVC